MRTENTSDEKFETRAVRRRELGRTLATLRRILAAEENYRDGMPENLQASARHDDACDAVDGLEEAIAVLECVY